MHFKKFLSSYHPAVAAGMWGKRSPGDEDDDNYDAEELDDADNNDERSHKTYRINPDFGKKSLLNSNISY